MEKIKSDLQMPDSSIDKMYSIFIDKLCLLKIVSKMRKIDNSSGAFSTNNVCTHTHRRHIYHSACLEQELSECCV